MRARLPPRRCSVLSNGKVRKCRDSNYVENVLKDSSDNAKLRILCQSLSGFSDARKNAGLDLPHYYIGFFDVLNSNRFHHQQDAVVFVLSAA